MAAEKPRKVAVLGPIPHDHITTHRGEVFDKYGCVLYTAAALSSLLGPEDSVVPVVHVREKDEGPIKELLAPFGNIDLSMIRSHTDRGDVVELTFVDQNFRNESQTGFMHPIMPDDVAQVIDADAFVCVPITDYEVPSRTLAFLRQFGKGTIMLDGHGPTVSLSPGGVRVPRLWIDRDTWLPNIDILKLNLEEAGCSWFPATRRGPCPPGCAAADRATARIRGALHQQGRQGGLRDPRRGWLRGLLPGRQRRDRGAPRAADPDRGGRRHHRLR